MLTMNDQSILKSFTPSAMTTVNSFRKLMKDIVQAINESDLPGLPETISQNTT